jgi:hypothetical protein
MASHHRPIEHPGVKGHPAKADTRAVSASRRRSWRDQPKLTWGAAGVAEEGNMTVEVDEAIENDVWRLSIDMPACYISIQIDSREQLTKLLKFLDMVVPTYPLPPSGEFQMGRPVATWVWDDETSGRLFLWLNRTGKHSIRAELDRQQAACIRAALVEATRPA